MVVRLDVASGTRSLWGPVIRLVLGPVLRVLATQPHRKKELKLAHSH